MGILDFLPAVMRRAEPAKVQRSEPVMARVPFQGMPMRQNQRAYSGAMFDRLTADWVAGSTSQDSETYSSLRQLRNRARQLVRDNDYAKNAKRSVQNNVVGTGMKLQPKIKLQRGGGLNKVANQAICDAWADWCVADSCDVAGKLSFSDIERMAIGGTAESGEIFVRIVRQKFGDSRIPFALEVIEADQCIDTKNGSTAGGGLIRMGVEMNQWKRPTGYWFWPNHPGDYNFAQNNTQRELFASAADVVHLYVSDRPGQTRGISWFHTAVKRLHHMEGYEEAEVIAQRANSSVMGFVTSASS
jgi:lambda family phage portal protein